MHRVIGQLQFTTEARAGFTFAHAAQQQNDLDGPQLLMRKHRTTIDAVDRLTVSTPIQRDVTALGLAQAPCPFEWCRTVRTTKALGMKVAAQPALTQLIITDRQNGKVHARRLTP